MTPQKANSGGMNYANSASTGTGGVTPNSNMKVGGLANAPNLLNNIKNQEKY